MNIRCGKYLLSRCQPPYVLIADFNHILTSNIFNIFVHVEGAIKERNINFENRRKVDEHQMKGFNSTQNLIKFAMEPCDA